MKALTFHGKRDVRADEVFDPSIQNPTDAIVRITSTAICGSNLHLYEALGMLIGVDDLTTHQVPLAEAPRACEMFQKKEDGATKVVLKP